MIFLSRNGFLFALFSLLYTFCSDRRVVRFAINGWFLYLCVILPRFLKAHFWKWFKRLHNRRIRITNQKIIWILTRIMSFFRHKITELIGTTSYLLDIVSKNIIVWNVWEYLHLETSIYDSNQNGVCSRIRSLCISFTNVFIDIVY